MLIDTNAYLGSFAFRRLQPNKADGLLRLMDAKGIDQALVSSANAITYRNAQAGNEELWSEVKAHSDRLLPCAVLNPAYAGWQDDLKTCHQEYGMRGLRLYPKWHNYALLSDSCRALITHATQNHMFVSIPLRVEDYRQQSWLVDVPDIPLDEIVALVKAFPQARFVLLNGIRYSGSPLGQNNNGLPDNYRLEISRLSALLDNEIGTLCARLGAHRLVFGTGMPFKYPDPAIAKIEVLGQPEAAKELIRSGNALRLLGH